MKLVDARCPKCGHISIDVFLQTADQPYPDCPTCQMPMERVYLPNSTGHVHGDEIPGGILIKNGLCHADGSPRRFYSHSEIRKEAERRGLVNVVEHAPPRGSDKSRHTTRWV